MALRRIRLQNHRHTVGKVFSVGTEVDFIDGFKELPGEQEVITFAGIRHPDGLIYAVERAGRHQHVIYLLQAYKKASPEEIQEQGFITNYGRYLTAQQALEFAQHNNQILPTRQPVDALVTEDLW